ncbi:aa3-type cytochrome oxidase subunit CtaJ [Gordonia sp. NPDC003376]
MDSSMVGIGVAVTVICVVFVIACVVSMAFSFGVKYPKVQEYKLDQPWTHKPLLFSAVDIEPMTLPRHAEPTDVDGGSASGKW